jgi:type IV pilus assembly protein PilB
MPTAMERKLGEMLVKDRVITQEDLESALKKQEETGTSLGHILVELGLASEWEMAAALGKQLNVPFITLSHYEIDRQVLESIPESIVRKYKIVPVDKTGDTLTIALSDPSNIYLLDELRLLTKCQIIPVISFESDISEAISRYYSREENNFEEMLKDITEQEMEVIKEEEEEGEDENDLAVEVNDAPVIQLVNLIIAEAIKAKASDIHVEPYEKTLRLRYRIDGALQEMTPPPKKFQNAIISRIKILSELDIAERRLPQDGRFKVRIQNRPIDFRVSVCPTAFGEKVVLRILDQGMLMLNLADLGFDPNGLKTFEEQIRQPWGMILVTGPTGSGKSTTLYSALSTINDPRKNIITIEDPIEYQIKGINQVQAKPEIGLTFAEGLRSFLRQDPDIVMVGEVRDLETAEIAVKAALTGHLVLTTLHTNDAPSSINRLTNMGVEPFLVTASVNLLVAQRLVRRICENCKEVYKPSSDILAALNIQDSKEVKIYKGVGCERCRTTGYKGRVALYEVLVVTDKMRDLIVDGVSTSNLKRVAIEGGMETLRQSGTKKILEGITSPEEVLATTVADQV